MRHHKDEEEKIGKVGKLADLKRVISQVISDVDENEFPKTIVFNRGIEYPKYKITIEVIEEDYFVDSKGVKWVKYKEDTE